MFVRPTRVDEGWEVSVLGVYRVEGIDDFEKGGLQVAPTSILFIPPLIPPGIRAESRDSRYSGGICRNEPEFWNSSRFQGNLGGNPPSIHYQRHNLKSTYFV